MSGRGYRHVSTFSPNDSNTISDRSGFKMKLSETMRTWQGWFVSKEEWEPRQPQDFPITAQKQQVYADSRSEQANPLEAAATFPPIV